MSGETWKLRLIATEAQAADAELAGVTLAAHELDDGRWAIEAYFDARPTPAVQAAFACLVPDSPPPHPVRLPDIDWIRHTQSMLPPVTAGRFHVFTNAHRHTLKPGQIGLHIEAGRAFGTGQHATTWGCLLAIHRLRRRPATALDLGTGTGVLAFAIAKRFRRARVTAADIDPVATATAMANARANGLRPGRAAAHVDLLTADGPRHPRLARANDVVVANILARPLVALAPALRPRVAPGGRLILAGLLQRQARRVASAYMARGFTLARWDRRTAWPVLELTRKRGR